MADERYIIDILLRAKDETARALASATGNLDDFGKKSAKTKREFDKLDTTDLSGLKNTLKSLDGHLKDVERDTKKAGEGFKFRDAEKGVDQLVQKMAQLEQQIKRVGDAREKGAGHQLAMENQRLGIIAKEVAEIQKEDDAFSAMSDRQISAGVRQETLYRLQADQRDRLVKLEQQLYGQTRKMATASERDLRQIQLQTNQIADAMRRLGGERVTGRVSMIMDEGAQARMKHEMNAVHAGALAMNAEIDRIRKRQAAERAAIRRDEFAAYREEERRVNAITAAEKKRMDQAARAASARERSLSQLDAEVNKLTRNMSDNRLTDSGAQLFEERFQGVIHQYERLGLTSYQTFERINEHVHQATREVDAFDNRVSKVGEDNSWRRNILDGMSELRESFLDSGAHVAAFDNQIRGMATLMIAGAMQPLLTIVMALGGAFVALAGSAAMAGGALGGALVAGIAMAIPVLGLLVAAFARVGAVMKAVQQQDLVNQQQAGRAEGRNKRLADSTNQIANAQDTLRGANENVARSHVRLREAQDRLTEARRQARRQLTDLILQERAAALAARGAAMSQAEAQDRLRASIAQGRSGDLGRDRLGIAEANLGRTQANVRLSRAREDAGAARRGGIEGMEGVVSARKAVDDARRGIVDAERAVVRAQRGLQQARRSANQAGADTFAAASKLNYMMGQLSAAEKRLYGAIQRLRETWKRNMRPITDIIVDSFTRAVDRVDGLLRNRRLLNAARGLATGIAGSIDRIMRSFTSAGAVNKFIAIMGEARKSLRPLTSIAINLGHAFMNIAIAAGPSFRRIAGWINDWSRGFRRLTGDTPKMRRFFATATDHLESWVKLAGAIGRLFIAVSGRGGGAAAGKAMVDDLTGSINRATRYVNSHTKEVRKFFDDVRTVMKIVGSVLMNLGRELGKSFDVKTVRALANIVNRILIPALGGAIRMLGLVIRAISRLASAPGASGVAKFGLQFIILGGVLLKFFGLFTPFFRIFAILGRWFLTLSRAMGGMRPALTLLGRAFGIVGVVIGVVVGAIKAVRTNFLGAGDAWRSLTSAFRRLGRQVADMFDDIFGTKRGEGIKKLGRIVKDVFNFAFKVAGAAAIHVLVIALKTVISVISRVVSVIGGIARAIRSAFNTGRRIVQAFVDFFQGEISWKEMAAKIAVALKDGFRGPINWLIDKINGLIEQFNKLPGPDIPKLRGVANDSGDASQGQGAVYRRSGGPIGKGYGGGDRVHLVAEEGEHVWSKEEVAKAGGHGAMFALRAFLGGGGQGVGGRFAIGGAVRGGGGKAGGGTDVDTVKAGMKDIVEIIENLGGDAVSAWDRTWDRINAISERGKDRSIADANAMESSIIKSMRNMSDDVRRVVDRMQDTVISKMKSMSRTAQREARRLANGVQDGMESAMNATYKGMDYISSTTNKALKAFDVDPVKLSIERPKGEKKATGGVIGQWGERGKDTIATVLGKGEVVLNWAQQKALNANLRGQETVQSVVEGTRAYHAGGPEQPGFAGGYVQGARPPKGPGSGPIRKLAEMLFKRGFSVTSGGEYRGTGTNHDAQRALDFGNSVNDMRRLWAILHPMRKKLAELFGPAGLPGAPAYRRGVPGGPVPGHEDHIHVALTGAIAGLGGMVDNVKRVKVGGTAGKMRDLVQAVLDKTRKGANSYLDKQMPDASASGGYMSIGSGAAGKKVFDFFVKRGFSKEQAAAWVGNLWQESKLSPTVVNPSSGATGLAQWLGGRLVALRQYANRQNKPVRSLETQLNFIWHELKGSESAAYGAIKRTRSLADAVRTIAFKYERMGANEVGDRMSPARDALRRYGRSMAVGGIVPGGEGQPVPILAHAGEWVLNKSQQMKAAMMAGISPSALKKRIGLPTGQSEAAEGTEVTATAGKTPKKPKEPEFEIPTVFSIAASALLRQQIDRLFTFADKLKRKSEKFIDNYIKAMENLTKEGGLLDILGSAVERGIAGTGRKMASSMYRTVNGIVKRNRTDIEQADRELKDLETNYDLLVGQQGAINRGLRRVNRRLLEIRRGGVTPKERKAYESLITQQRNLQERMNGVTDAINENISSQFAAQAAALAATIEDVNRTGSRRIALSELTSRAADIRQAMGDAAGAMGLRGGALQARGSAMRDQIGDLAPLLARAITEGNEESQRTLEEQIMDLNMQLAENEMQIRENNTQLRQVHIDNIVNRQQFRGGVFGGLQGILQTVGDISGVSQQTGMAEMVRRVIGELTTAGGGLRAQLREITGIDLGGLSGAQFVNAVSSLDFDKLTQGMTESQRQQFEALINAIIENEAAVQTNTQQLRELDGTLGLAQTFSSSAWTQFRQAIFNGSGGLMPAYDLPGLGGGPLGAPPPAMALAPLARASVQPNGLTRVGASGDNIDIDINEVREKADPQEIAMRIMWEKRQRGRR